MSTPPIKPAIDDEHPFIVLYQKCEMYASMNGIDIFDLCQEARAEYKRWMKAVRDGDVRSTWMENAKLAGMWKEFNDFALEHGILASPISLPGSKKSTIKALKRKDQENFTLTSNKNPKTVQTVPKTVIDFTTPNPFENLTDFSATTENSSLKMNIDDNDTESETESVTSQPPKFKSPRTEPITIKKSENYADIINDIETNILKKPTRKFLKGDTVKVFPDSLEDYRTIKNYLEEKALEYFALKPKNERPKKVLLRGLPPETPIEKIKTELSNRNLEIHRVSQLKDFKTKARLPLFLVDIFPTDNHRTIFNIDLFLGYYVKIVVYRWNGPKQCWNCQRWNHSSETCRFNSACMKCAGPHKTPDCPPNDNLKIKCANCQEGHTSNYSGFKFHPRNIKNNRSAATRNSNIPFNSNHVNPTLSYSNLTKGAPLQVLQTPNTPPSLNNENFPPLTTQDNSSPPP